MLNHPTLDKLQALRFTGMAKAFEEQLKLPDIDALSFEERLGLLVDRELTERADRRLASRLKQAKLRQSACVEDIDFRHRRSLDKALMTKLATCQWLREHLNVIVTGPTGIGKSYLACALAHKACLEGFTALYARLPRLLEELAIARADGRYPKLLAAYAKTDLLVLDDWGLAPLNAEQRRDLLELLDDRHGLRSTLITSQLPVDQWHALIGDPTFADAILDRLIHNAYRLNLTGESLRKTRSCLTAAHTDRA
jgi:DNA replication protein DnaC